MSHIYRKLGLRDRYSLTRSLIQFPPIVAMIVSIPLSGASSDIDQEVSKIESTLSSRISKLLEILPLLSARVSDARTKVPKWSRSDRIITSEDISKVTSYENEVGLEEILSTQLELGIKSLNPELAPMWRVDVHYSLQSKVIFIGLSVNHCMADGKGCFNLLRLLISPPVDLSKELTQDEIFFIRGEKEIVDASDVYYDQRPGLDLLLPSKFRSSVLPKLPSIIQSYFKEKEFWPFKLEKRIQDCQPGLVLLRFKEKDFLKDLKGISKEFGLKSLHSLVHSAIIVGILSLVLAETKKRLEGDGGRPADFDSRERGQIRIKTDTPIDIRKKDVGSVVGNFVANLGWEGELDEDSSFLEITRDYERHLNSKEGRDKAMKFAGMLGHIADGENPGSNEREPTKWETHFNSIESFGGSFSISNLGAMPSLQLDDLGIEDLVWCQTPSVFTVAMVIDVIGLLADENSEGGFSITIGFRDGCLAKEAVKKLASVVESTLQDLVEGNITEKSKVRDLLSRAWRREEKENFE